MLSNMIPNTLANTLARLLLACLAGLASALAVPAGARAEAEGPAAVDAITQARNENDARIRDEAQVGDYVAPAFEPRPRQSVDEVRGNLVPIPVPGLNNTLRHKPGAGVWLGEAPAGANVFLNGARSKVSVDLKLGF